MLRRDKKIDHSLPIFYSFNIPDNVAIINNENINSRRRTLHDVDLESYGKIFKIDPLTDAMIL